MSADYSDIIDLSRLAGLLGIEAEEITKLAQTENVPWLGSSQYGNGRMLVSRPAADRRGVVMQREDAIEFVHRVLDYHLSIGLINEQLHEQRLTEALLKLSSGL